MIILIKNRVDNMNSEKLKIILDKTKSILIGIGTILLYFFVALIGNMIFGKYYKSSNLVIATLSQLGTYALILLILVIIYHKKLIIDAKNFKKEYFEVAIKNWILGLGIMIISNIIITTFTNDISVNEAANRELLMTYPISNIISMVIIGPFIEEITFRLSFKKAFTKWYTFALVTSILFGLMHIADFKLLEFFFIIPYGALGFFFAKAMYETDNVFTSFIAHMIHNAICVVIILLF
ncbi:MAG: CPBP family intramembrane metalloprotease [Firmicutes bacterium]|nr:CPBP family intramembrane metalloprotease [Bacillota bacterium]